MEALSIQLKSHVKNAKKLTLISREPSFLDTKMEFTMEGEKCPRNIDILYLQVYTPDGHLLLTISSFNKSLSIAVVDIRGNIWRF
ncbi:hypothetical protein L2E82_02510 [Cichorium intybus]|uniref:Uncharacterized protein n=1 Tax=Cichorium intybus TaxID=13427 RepID=A0ACB9H2D6_CICIN|nr:hypothetical protein L2E82_02510 [Cichorium intybus]